MLARFFGISEAFQNAPGIVRHGGIAASFGNNDAAVAAGVHICVEIIISKESCQHHRPVKDVDLRNFRAEEESGGIKCFGVKIRKEGVDQLFQIAVLRRIRQSVNGKQHMEFRSRFLAVFHLHMVAAVVNRKGHAGKCGGNIGGIDPVLRIIAVVVVAVDRETIRSEEIIVVAVAASVFGADIVVRHGLQQRVFIGHRDLMRVDAVLRHPQAVGAVQCKSHRDTSLQVSLK